VTYTRGPDLSGSLQGAGGIGGLLARSQPSHPTAPHAYYHSDGSGNITALINENQQVVARYSYAPFGSIIAQSGYLADANTMRFSSKEWLPMVGLSYYGYRFYDPSLQRWLNQDPIGELGGLNLYGFTYNNPVNNVDTDGRFVLSLTMLVIDAGSAITHGLKGDYRGMARDLAFTVLDGVSLAADLGSGGLGGTAMQGGRLALQAVMLKNRAGLIAGAAHLIPDTVHSSSSGGFCERDPHPLDPSSPLYPHPEGKKEYPGLDLDHLYSQTGFPNLRTTPGNLDFKPAVENRGPKARWEKELLEWERIARAAGMTDAEIRSVTQSE
jgi:RHS repeat-associated protein